MNYIAKNIKSQEVLGEDVQNNELIQNVEEFLAPQVIQAPLENGDEIMASLPIAPYIYTNENITPIPYINNDDMILPSPIISNAVKNPFINIEETIEPPEEVSSLDPLLENIEIHKKYHRYYQKHIAQYVLTVGNTNELDEDYYKLKNININLCSCGRKIHGGNVSGEVEIIENSETNTRHLSGVITCGSNSACPVCAARLSKIRGGELATLMDCGRKNGRSYIMVVVTIPHSPGEKLKITLNQMLKMSQYMFNSGEYKKNKKLLKIDFIHYGLENMVSFKNNRIDWHPHKNYLLDFSISLEEVLKIMDMSSKEELILYISEMFTRLGQKYLDKNNIDKVLLKPYLQKVTNKQNQTREVVKGGCAALTDFDDKYITKWGLASEMTGSVYKDGKFDGSFHPFGLLDFIDIRNKEVNEKQKYQCIKGFQEFALASKGKTWFKFGAKAVDYYKDNYALEIRMEEDHKAKEEEEEEEEEKKNKVIHTFTNEEWISFEATPLKIAIAFSIKDEYEMLSYFYTEIENNRIKNIEASYY